MTQSPDNVAGTHSATPSPIKTINTLMTALVWLLEDLSDAEDDRHPDTGEEYSSVTTARQALADAQVWQPLIKQQLTDLTTRLQVLEDALSIATPYVHRRYNQLPGREDTQELNDLNTCRRALALTPLMTPGEDKEDNTVNLKPTPTPRRQLMFGVFRHDCHGLTEQQIQEALLEIFEDYADALKYREGHPLFAIHFTHLTPTRHP